MRAAVSCLVVSSIVLAAWMNVPALHRALPRTHRAVAAVADKAGLDTRWIMFGTIPRPHWHYVIKARYAGGEEVLLPLPLQGDRSFLERHLFDFKDAKIHTNLFRARPWRRAYAHYLAHRFPERGGRPVEAVVYELWIQEIVDPGEAERRGTHKLGEPRLARREEFRPR